MEPFQQFLTFLAIAERMFGPRNPAYVVDRVFFVDGGTPCRLMVSYTGFGSNEAKFHCALHGICARLFSLSQLRMTIEPSCFETGKARPKVQAKEAARFPNLTALVSEKPRVAAIA
jgi:hypothetical protein